MRPNIFDIATKELNQDAFITWLLKFADNKYKATFAVVGVFHQQQKFAHYRRYCVSVTCQQTTLHYLCNKKILRVLVINSECLILWL